MPDLLRKEMSCSGRGRIEAGAETQTQLARNGPLPELRSVFSGAFKTR